jgi:hypothetical protein
MKSILFGMLLAYSGLVYAGKVEAPTLPEGLKKTTKRAPAAAAGASTMTVTGSVSLGGEYVMKVQDSSNGVVCYAAMGSSQQITAMHCLGAKDL